MTKKSYTLVTEDEQIIEFIEFMAKRWHNPKSRVLLAGLYALMEKQGIPDLPDLGLDVGITLGEIAELKVRMNHLEAKMSEFHLKNPEKIRFSGNNYNDDWFEDNPPF